MPERVFKKLWKINGMSENLTHCFSTFLLDPPCLTSEILFHVRLVNETSGHSYKQQGRPGLEEYLNICLSSFLSSFYCRSERRHWKSPIVMEERKKHWYYTLYFLLKHRNVKRKITVLNQHLHSTKFLYHLLGFRTLQTWWSSSAPLRDAFNPVIPLYLPSMPSNEAHVWEQINWALVIHLGFV